LAAVFPKDGTLVLKYVADPSLIPSLWRCDPTRAVASSFFRFSYHTQTHRTR